MVSPSLNMVVRRRTRRRTRRRGEEFNNFPSWRQTVPTPFCQEWVNNGVLLLKRIVYVCFHNKDNNARFPLYMTSSSIPFFLFKQTVCRVFTLMLNAFYLLYNICKDLRYHLIHSITGCAWQGCVLWFEIQTNRDKLIKKTLLYNSTSCVPLGLNVYVGEQYDS